MDAECIIMYQESYPSDRPETHFHSFTSESTMPTHAGFANNLVGFISGNHYGEVNVPEELWDDIGYVIGKQGFYMRMITEASGAESILYNPATHKFEITAGNARFHYPIKTAEDLFGVPIMTPPRFDEAEWVCGEDDEFFEGNDIVQDARERLIARMERSREELAAIHGTA